MPDNVIVEYVGANSAKALKNKWWLDNEDMSRSLFAVVRFIDMNQEYRSKDNITFARLYANTEILGLTSSTYARASSTHLPNTRLTLNVVKSCVDAATNKIAQNKPRPMFLTEKGNFSLKQKAKKLTQYLDGMFDELNLYHHAQRVFVDACVFGTGALKVFIDPQTYSVKAERVFIDEIVVDDVEGKNGQPRQIFQKKTFARELLLDQFPKFAEQIKACASSLTGEYASQSTADEVAVVEAWHLPSGPNAKDGKHVIAIENQVLFQEDYQDDCFPFVFFRWSERLLGFFGSGLAFELIGIQREINKTLKTIQQSLELMAVPRIFLDIASNINSKSITDQIGNIIKYQGSPPVFSTPPAVSPELIQHLESLYRKAYEITGISQMQAQSKKPSGLDSGVAIREFNDVASERFIVTGQNYEQFFLDTSKLLINLSRKLYEQDKSPDIKVKGKDFIETIKWKDVDLDNDQFSMRVFPVSLLPTTPAGKLQMVQELLQAGLIPQEQALALLDFPDIEGFLSLQVAAQDTIEKYMETMLDEGKMVVFDPYMEQFIPLALDIATKAYMRAKNDGTPESRIDLLRVFIDDLKAQSAPSPEELPATGPVGNPAAPPTSDLLPIQGAPAPAIGQA